MFIDYKEYKIFIICFSHYISVLIGEDLLFEPRLANRVAISTYQEQENYQLISRTEKRAIGRFKTLLAELPNR
jgi:hypothetical protein